MAGFTNSVAAFALAASALGASAPAAAAQDYGTMRQTCVDALNKDPSFMTPFPHLNKGLGATGNTGCEATGTTVTKVFDLATQKGQSDFSDMMNRYTQLNDAKDRNANGRADAQRRQDPLGINGVMGQVLGTDRAINQACAIARRYGKQCP